LIKQKKKKILSEYTFNEFVHTISRQVYEKTLNNTSHALIALVYE